METIEHKYFKLTYYATMIGEPKNDKFYVFEPMGSPIILRNGTWLQWLHDSDAMALAERFQNPDNNQIMQRPRAFPIPKGPAVPKSRSLH